MDTRRETGGLLGALVGAALVAFVVVAGAATYYALEPVTTPLAILAAEPEAPQGGSGRDFCVKVLTASHRWPLDEAQREKLAAVLLVAARRIEWLAVWGPPAALVAFGALLEGLWAREGIRSQLGFSSAALFSVGKLALGLAALTIVAYPFVPIHVGPIGPIGSATLLAALGAYSAARSLPIRL